MMKIVTFLGFRSPQSSLLDPPLFQTEATFFAQWFEQRSPNGFTSPYLT